MVDRTGNDLLDRYTDWLIGHAERPLTSDEVIRLGEGVALLDLARRLATLLTPVAMTPTSRGRLYARLAGEPDAATRRDGRPFHQRLLAGPRAGWMALAAIGSFLSVAGLTLILRRMRRPWRLTWRRSSSARGAL